MTPADLFLSLNARGLSLRADGERLLVTPAGKLTEGEREQVRQHKAALLTLVGGSGGSVQKPAWPESERYLLEVLRDCYRGSRAEYDGPTQAWLYYWCGAEELFGEKEVRRALAAIQGRKVAYVWEDRQGQRPVSRRRVGLCKEYRASKEGPNGTP